MRDQEDGRGINEALEAHQRGLARNAPQMDQMMYPQREPDNNANGQTINGAAASPNDFVNMLQNYAGGQAPDFNALIAQYEQMNQPAPEKKGMDLLLDAISKGALGYLEARSGQTSGRNSALAGGVGRALSGIYAGKEATAKEGRESKKKSHADLLKIAEDQRKYGLENKKADSTIAKNQRTVQSADVLDELRRAQTEKARRPSGGGADWMDKLLVGEEVRAKGRKAERQEKALEDDMQTLPGINELETTVHRMQELVPHLATGKGSGIKTFASGLVGGEIAQASSEFDNLKLPLFKAYKEAFGPQISNDDRKAIDEMIAGKQMPRETLIRVLNNMDANVATKKLRIYAKEAYMNKHGTSDKFETTFSKLISANPIHNKKTGTIDQAKVTKIMQDMRGSDEQQPQAAHNPQKTLQVEQHDPQEVQNTINQFMTNGVAKEEIMQALQEEGIDPELINSLNYGQ